VGSRIENRGESRVGGRIESRIERLSDLYIVVHCEVAHGLGIRIAVLAVGLQGEAQLASMGLQHGVEHKTILHPTIHTLNKGRHLITSLSSI
jgi:hypothetical protein